MHLAAKIGIAATTAGAAGYGLYALGRNAEANRAEDRAALKQQVSDQFAAYAAWSAKFEEQFPGGRVDTHADHARLDAFLRDNPAPSWLTVEHAGSSEVQLGWADVPVDREVLPDPEAHMFAPIAVASGLASAAIGGFMALDGFTGGVKNPWATAGTIAGGTAMGMLGVGLLGGVVATRGEDTGSGAYEAFVDRVQADMD